LGYHRSSSGRALRHDVVGIIGASRCPWSRRKEEGSLCKSWRKDEGRSKWGVNSEMGIQRTSHSAAGGAPVDSNAPDIELQGEKKTTGRVASAKKKKLNSEAWGPLKGSLCESCSLTWGTD